MRREHGARHGPGSVTIARMQQFPGAYGPTTGIGLGIVLVIVQLRFTV
jgi:hypothetical protein